MSFSLQLGHLKIRSGPFPVARSISEALKILFREQEESVYVFWHDVPIRFRYKQDLTRSFDNILAMLWLMQREDEGATKVELDAQLLTARLEVRWDDEACHVHAVFTERDPLYEPYAEALNRSPHLSIDKRAFLSEWKTLLHQLIVSIEAGGVIIRDGTERRKWEMLQSVEHGIADYGRIYTRA